jgi:ATP-binding cassette subfamily B protein
VFFDLDTSLDAVARATQSQGSRVAQPINGSARLLNSVLTVVAYMAVLAHFNPWLPWPVLATLLPILWVNLRIGSRRFGLMVTQTPTRRRLQYTFNLNIMRESATELRVFGLADFIFQQWAALFDQTRRERMAVERRAAVSNMSVEASAVLGVVAVLCALVWLAVHGELSVAEVVGALQATTGIYGASQAIAQGVAGLLQGSLMINELFRFLDTPEEGTAVASDPVPFPRPLTSGIKVTGLGFRYPRSPGPVLRDVTFSVKPGQTIAIVGPNGSGKTTLVKCLLGLYAPTEGSIAYDGVPVTRINAMDIRKHVTAIFQDFVRYEWTLRDNVAAGRIERRQDGDWIRAQLGHVGATDWIASLQGGIDTQLGPQFNAGIGISGGQWQRVAIARALVREADVIVLDEPTAALDPMSEADLFRRLLEIKNPHTITMFISHRLGFCPFADWILMMDQGQVAQQGRHQQLVREPGPYRDFFASQSELYHGTSEAAVLRGH